MVKVTLKLAVCALIAYAGFQGIPPYYNNWKFTDALKELATFPGYRATLPQVLEKCERIAREHDLELTKDDFEVVLGEKGKGTTIDTKYVVVMKYIPGKPQPHEFVIHVEGDPPRFGSLTP
jgi:hypothetical protein